MDTLIRTELVSGGVLIATIDLPGRTMNVFSSALMDALEALMDHVDSESAVASVVITSGKPSFLAGADLAMVRGFTDSARTDTQEQMFIRCGRLGRLFFRLEESAKPWVAAVNGTALGGGLELALACRARLVCDDPRALLGVPEVRLGLLPGAGGTQRLPRLIGFAAAMPLLLGGRPIDPKTAVALGIFERAVPAAELLVEATALSRRLQSEPYDPAAKFPHLRQHDVPDHSPEVARRVALEHGVTAADFEAYPAYGAIVDSVLLSAGFDLSAAGAIEMQQFLRLMFDPVAGNMVRTLFLNKQRAERDLAKPTASKFERIGIGPLSEGNRAWAALFSRLKVQHEADPALPLDAIEILDSGGGRHLVAVRGPGNMAEDLPDLTIVLWPSGPHGRVVEIVATDEEAAAVLALLPGHLGALAYRTQGKRSALLALARTAVLDVQAVTALRLSAEGLAPEPELLDVAACVAGVTPAWTGGPFTHLWQNRARLVPQLQADDARAWADVEPRLQQAYA